MRNRNAITNQQIVLGMILSICLMMVVGCNSKFVPVTYKSMLVMETTYDTALTICGDLYKQGIIEESQKEKIIQGARVFQETYDLLGVALLNYERAKDKDNLEKVMLAMGECLANYDRFITLFELFTHKTLPKGTIPDREYIVDRVATVQ